MRRLKILLMSLPMAVYLFPSSAFALDMEYYTWHGFKPIVDAFKKIALIFSDNSYLGMFVTVMIMGIMISGAIHYARAMASGNVINAGSLNWLLPVIAGIMIFVAFIRPTGTLIIHDEISNQDAIVAGIPDGVVLVAGVTNTIERGFVNIIATSSIYGYNIHGGGLGFETLLHMSEPYAADDSYMTTSMKQYVDDCVAFEAVRVGSTLSIKDLQNATVDVLNNQFSLAANPAVMTTVYSSDYQGGEVATCEIAFRGGQTYDGDTFIGLEPYFNDSNSYTNTIAERCGMAGYDPNNAAELAQCKSSIATIVEQTTGVAGISAVQLAKQSILMHLMNDFVEKKSPEFSVQATANMNQMSSGVGIGLVMNQWLPVMKAVTTAVAISMVPFLAIFIPTGLIGRALKYLVGFFVWLMCWGITDAITTNLATDYALDVFQGIKQSSLGFNSIMAMPNASQKALALFGGIRSSGIMFATIISVGLFRLGEGMSFLANSMSGQMHAEGSRGGQLLTPQGQASAINSYSSSMAALGHAKKYDFEDRVDALSSVKSMQTSSVMSSMSDLGYKRGEGLNHGRETGEAKGHDGSVATRTTEKTVDTIGSGSGMVHANRVSEYKAAVQTGGVKTSEGGAEWIGGSQEAYQKFKQGGFVISNDAERSAVNRTLGFTNGEGPAKIGMQLLGAGVSAEGNLMFRSAKYQDKYGSETIEGGKLIREGTFNTKQEALDYAQTLKDRGHHHAAQGLINMTKGMHQDEAIQYREISNLQGDKKATFAAQHGANTDWVDLEKRTSGKDSRALDISTQESDKGIKIAQATALQRVLTQDPSMVSPLTSAKSDREREAAVAAIVSPLGAAMAPFMSRTGQSSDYTRAEANMSLGVGTPSVSPVKASIDGTAGVGGQRSDSKQTNLMNQSLASTLINADTYARSQSTWSEREKNTYVMNKLHEEVHTLAEEYIQNNPDKFGASTGPNYAKEKAQEMLNKIKP